ncbi:hypothetical protein BBO99_00001851 [Phytophthora kernoviae]|uniref:Uncharacterized protein n=2 Tax=Phytophthora kernoviae TaxID=325452 RepID=A0A421F9L6_9STRA|nr:hypothetical protein G195_001779 [Phytophthora kernoviae 00238/432]KAG2531031.1 hypothetical protein JM16_001350 [Phytophthora kernoviae]KAG2531622.1 hypothetical protein JM18_001631 [Phytophthora kernoviae]RLN31771.1 hypothetical protein BBI17_001615 [Phytophthora kernoviae]RLN83760.1 hypothetical protein BBO99_00001851 [Phytophthora kernoviae]
MTRAAVGGSRSVESYLRNFEGEKARYQEILEITLCYGVQCLAQTFSLKGINCDELRIITGYDAARKRDFYVRNVSRQVSKRTLQRTPVELRTKPSHSWRDGEEDMADFHPPATRTEPESCVNLEDAAVEPDPRKELVTPRSLQHVRSKLQPELDARRQKILRVKKTQSQRMAETLARARLAEYDAQRELQDVRERRLGPKKMPLSEITKGAAALEIVDDFMKSPLMDKFGHDGPTASNNSKHPTSDCIQQRRSQPDPLKEELYGTTALDNSFLGSYLEDITNP